MAEARDVSAPSRPAAPMIAALGSVVAGEPPRILTSTR